MSDLAPPYPKTPSLLLNFILLTLVLSPFGPLATASSSSEGESGYTGSIWLGPDISEYPLTEGRPYLGIEDGQPLFSATSWLKQNWWDAGSPGIVYPFSSDFPQRTSGRACEDAWSQGQTATVPISGGSITVEARKITSTAAFLVQQGTSFSSTALNNLGTIWESTIYPTDTNYFGNPPDLDNNCQVEIILYPIDGAYNIGGYFAPGLASGGESIYVDTDDADLSWGRVILAHEFQHLLHNARDPNEYIWVDEGNADMAAYLCFGADSTLVGHANAWLTEPHYSVRWWNQRIADYGAGLMFMLYLSEYLGGADAIRTLVADTSTGGTGIENLARNPMVGAPGGIGTTMPDIYANFTAATALDSAQTPFGFPSITLSEGCGGSVFCKLHITESITSWESSHSSSGHTVEGWGLRHFKFTGGTGSTLNMMVQGSDLGFAGQTIRHDIASDAWVTEPLTFTESTGTGLIPGFGNISDEVHLIVWLESAIADCSYNYCGTYPTATLDLQVGLISEPASLNLTTQTTFDNDEDGSDDSMEMGIEVYSQAFYEVLDLRATIMDSNGTQVDSLDLEVEAGGGKSVNIDLFFHAPRNDSYQLEVKMTDKLGGEVDNGASALSQLSNMKPIAEGDVEPPMEQTWKDIQYTGAGIDNWGLSTLNGTYRHTDLPVGYLWDFGDGNSSTLRNPVRHYRNTGNFTTTLQVLDSGGAWSEPLEWNVTIIDDQAPIALISIDGNEMTSTLSLLTNQRILFSGVMSEDNTPSQYLDFHWDWGDGNTSEGIEAHHAWPDGSLNGTGYTILLTVSDGILEGNTSLDVKIYNRPPRDVLETDLVVDTLTPLKLPAPFVDDDGAVINLEWEFSEGVNLDGGIIEMSDDFSATSSTDWVPTPAWLTAGIKVVNVTATDDDGATSTKSFTVTVLDQAPVAMYPRPDDGTVDTQYHFDGTFSSDPDGDDAALTYNWSFSNSEEFLNEPTADHQFTTPGSHTVTLVVTDEAGEVSMPKTYVIRIDNPPPIVQMQVNEAWLGGNLVMSDTPRDEDSQFAWSHPFTDEGAIFAAPGTLLKFTSEGTRDGDERFAGKSIPINSSDPDWNGITQYTWDFGDAAPLDHSFETWHHYEEPGTYLISLTVRDGFGTGDTTTITRWVIINHPPDILSISVPTVVTADTTSLLDAAAARDEEISRGISAWRDLNLEGDNDNDGILDNDEDENLNGELTFWWDIDNTQDEDKDGDPTNDWVRGSSINAEWAQAGWVKVTLMVCDGLNSCSDRSFRIQVVAQAKEETLIEEFNWKALMPKEGKEGAVALGLLAVVSVLAWLLMRTPTEDEAEADEAAATYDVAAVQAEGGIMGMDHHIPPKVPKHLARDERTNSDSGYTRPVSAPRRRR